MKFKRVPINFPPAAAKSARSRRGTFAGLSLIGLLFDRSRRGLPLACRSDSVGRNREDRPALRRRRDREI